MYLLAFISVFIVKATGLQNLYTKCTEVDVPVTVTCGPDEVIYIHQTTLSDWYGTLTPACDITLRSNNCYVYSNHRESEINGKQEAKVIFDKEYLSKYPVQYGMCNASSVAAVVIIVFECVAGLSELGRLRTSDLERLELYSPGSVIHVEVAEGKRPGQVALPFLDTQDMYSICDRRHVSDSGTGFLTSPGFPNPETNAIESCECELTATDQGVVLLTGIFVNPVLPNSDQYWTLEVVNEMGTSEKISDTPVMASPIDVYSTRSVRLRFSSSGDLSQQQTHFTSYPAGFWIRYRAHPLNVKLILQCSGRPETKIGSTGSIGLICGLTLAFLVFLLTVVFCGRKLWRKHQERKDNSSSTENRNTNSGLEIDRVHNEPKRRTTRCYSIPEICFESKLSNLKLFEEGKRKLSTSSRKCSISSNTSSGCEISVITLKSCEKDEFTNTDDDIGSYTFSSYDFCNLEGVTDEEIDI